MAKEKKQNLSEEELLGQALVPEDEHPYEVPGNWVWTKLNYTALYRKGPFGSSLTKVMFVPKSINTYKVYEQGNAIRKDKNYGSYYITEEKFNDMKGFKVEPGDLIVSCAGTVGETYQLPDDIEPGIINQALMKVKVNNNVNIKYFIMYFDQILRNDIAGKSKGTAIKNIPPFSVLKSLPFPLPPLAEQHRIVDRIERLFAKLDVAKELAQNALDSFETRKAAILHKAFTGELTAKWREEYGVGLESWGKMPLGDICTSLQYGTSKKSSSEGKVIVIRMGNLQDGEIIWDSLAYTDDEEDIEKYLLHPGDVLFNRTNSPELVGKTSIYRGEYPAIFAGYIIRLKYDNIRINGEYLNFVMNSVQAKEYCNAVKTDGVNQSNINAKKIAAFNIPIPSLEEQNEIVRILTRLIDKEKNAMELTNVIDRIVQLKKSILARAFRGELVTNVPTEESAVELLKEMLVK